MRTKKIGLWASVLLPCVVLFSGILNGLWKNYQTWGKLEPELAKYVAQHEGWVAVRGNNPLEDAASVEIRELLRVENVLKYQADVADLDPNLRLPFFVAPGSDWPEEPLFKIFADNTSQFWDRMKAIPTDQLQSFDEKVFELLLIEAFQGSDFEKAFKLLSLLKQRLDTTDLGLAGNQEMQKVLAHKEFASIIGESLRYDVWTPEQLDEMATWLAKPLPEQKWLRQIEIALKDYLLMNDFRAVSVSTTGKLVEAKLTRWSPAIDSLLLTDAFRRADTAVAGIDEKRKFKDGGVFSPAVSKTISESTYHFRQPRELADAIGLVERWRQLMLAALEVKRYKIREGQWPEDLKAVAASEQSRLKSGARYQYVVVSPDQVTIGIVVNDVPIRKDFLNDLFYFAWYEPVVVR